MTKFGPRLFTESVFESVNLLVWMGECLIQCKFAVITKILSSIIQQVSVV